MPNVAASPAGQLVMASSKNRAQLSRLTKSGRALRLASGIYAIGATLPPEAVARQHRWALIDHIWPGAVLSGRTALAGGEPDNGFLYVSHPDPARSSDLKLPGLTIRPQIGPGQLPGDMPLPHALWLSGVARGLVENVNLPGRPLQSRAGTTAVEDRMDEIARTGGAGRVQTLLGELDVIAGSFTSAAVDVVRSRLTALLGSFGGSENVQSSRLSARLQGQPYDDHRLSMLDSVVSVLARRAPLLRMARADDPRWQWLPFFEAYFSNYIEGTRFGVDEARGIALDGVVPASRPADAHDVVATYRLAVDPQDAGRVPASSNDLVEILRHRHGVLMAARPDKRPGEFKEVPNYAGGYRFVDPDLVVGTLRRGFDALNAVIDPFARAVAMMVLVTECHPFDDGNGRVARLMVNSELTAAGQTRIVIPTVYRNNYLAGLTGVSNGAGEGQGLIAVLEFAQLWTSVVQWDAYELADADLTASNAYVEPGEAELSGTRLRLPPQLGASG